jgi:hypothetical protein
MRTPAIGAPRVIVLGLLAHAPYGGMTWQVLHHLKGLKGAVVDLWYVEDSDSPNASPSTLCPTEVGLNAARIRYRGVDTNGRTQYWKERSRDATGWRNPDTR